MHCDFFFGKKNYMYVQINVVAQWMCCTGAVSWEEFSSFILEAGNVSEANSSKQVSPARMCSL
jgi:hypothetical protein